MLSVIARRSRSRFDEDKLVAYILVLALHATDFTLNSEGVAAVAKDLKIGVEAYVSRVCACVCFVGDSHRIIGAAASASICAP